MLPFPFHHSVSLCVSIHFCLINLCLSPSQLPDPLFHFISFQPFVYIVSNFSIFFSCSTMLSIVLLSIYFFFLFLGHLCGPLYHKVFFLLSLYLDLYSNVSSSLFLSIFVPTFLLVFLHLVISSFNHPAISSLTSLSQSSISPMYLSTHFTSLCTSLPISPLPTHVHLFVSPHPQSGRNLTISRYASPTLSSVSPLLYLSPLPPLPLVVSPRGGGGNLAFT